MKIHELLLLNEFEPYSYNPFNRHFTKIPKFGSANTIYLRDLPFVKERVEKAVPFKIFGQKIWNLRRTLKNLKDKFRFSKPLIKIVDSSN